MAEPEILSLEEVRSLLAEAFAPEGCTGVSAKWCPIHGDCICPEEDFEHVECPLHGRASSHADDVTEPMEALPRQTVARLCATVMHHAFNADALANENLASAAKNVRLSALVARMREALEASLEEYSCHCGEVEGGVCEWCAVQSILSDPFGKNAAEELRLLRACEDATLTTEAQDDPDERLTAARLQREAWQALRAFRQSQKGTPS